MTVDETQAATAFETTYAEAIKVVGEDMRSKRCIQSRILPRWQR